MVPGRNNILWSTGLYFNSFRFWNYQCLGVFPGTYLNKNWQPLALGKHLSIHPIPHDCSYHSASMRCWNICLISNAFVKQIQLNFLTVLSSCDLDLNGTVSLKVMSYNALPQTGHCAADLKARKPSWSQGVPCWNQDYEKWSITEPWESPTGSFMYPLGTLHGCFLLLEGLQHWHF